AATVSRADSATECHLILYIAATKAGEAAMAERALAAAAADLGSSRREERLAAAMLTAAERPDPEAALKLAMPVEEKLLFAAAMGMRFPADSARYFGLARRLNFSTQF